MSVVAPIVAEVPAELRRCAVGVLVVHDEEVVQFGWRLALSRHDWAKRCVAASDAARAVEHARRFEIAVAVLDLDAGHQQAATTAAALRAAAPDIRILLTTGRTLISSSRALAIGATGVVDKTLPAADLANAVLAVASGQRVFAASAPRGASHLSARECEVLGLLTIGATNREIATYLDVSLETIKQHAKTIYRKLGVRNRTEAAQRGGELGLGAPDAGALVSAA